MILVPKEMEYENYQSVHRISTEKYREEDGYFPALADDVRRWKISSSSEYLFFRYPFIAFFLDTILNIKLNQSDYRALTIVIHLVDAIVINQLI